MVLEKLPLGQRAILTSLLVLLLCQDRAKDGLGVARGEQGDGHQTIKVATAEAKREQSLPAAAHPRSMRKITQERQKPSER